MVTVTNTNTLPFYDVEFLRPLKGFIVQAQVANLTVLFGCAKAPKYCVSNFIVKERTVIRMETLIVQLLIQLFYLQFHHF